MVKIFYTRGVFEIGAMALLCVIVIIDEQLFRCVTVVQLEQPKRLEQKHLTVSTFSYTILNAGCVAGMRYQSA
jgi:hypothetical protein